jgi:hypothetical protein
VYVTTQRIIVNKGRGQLSLKAHFLAAFLVLFAPLVPPIVAVAVVLALPFLIAFSYLRQKKVGRRWPTIERVESGHRQLEVTKGQVLSIELKQPRRLRSGHVVITSLSNEPFDLRILGRGVFKTAKRLLVQFQVSKIMAGDRV